jgi:Glycosyltransferase family 87
VTALAGRLSRPELLRTAAIGACLAVFLVSWGLIHRGFYAESPIVDTGLYQAYGDAVLRGEVPYRDFDLEYPPGALPVFVLPSLAPAADYVAYFEWLMATLGLATILVVARIRLAAAAFVAVSPLLVGSLLLSRFDLWPVFLTTSALVALLLERHRLGWGLLGAAVTAKLWPFLLVPLALVWSARRGRARAALWGLGVFVAVVVPFALLAPGGLWHSVWVQASRPLQIESLAASFVTTFGSPVVETSHGSQNLVGRDVLAALSTVAEVAVVVALWVAFARRPVELERFAAAAVAAFVAFGKVLSPQFLVWLVPLVPLVRGRRGGAATALLTVALVLTQAWFPARYWDYVYEQRLAGVVLGRNLVLVALVAVLALPLASRRRMGDSPA